MDVENDVGSFTDTLMLQGNVSAADARLRVVFEETEIEDTAATLKEGRPIFKTKHIGHVYVPGDKDNVVTFDAERMDRDQIRRFGAKYREWKQTRENKVEGTLLRECGGLMSRARAREYEALHIFTVEQLAALSDTNIRNLRGAIAERQKAKDFLSAAAGRAPLQEARAENEKLKAQLSALTEQVGQLTKLLEERTEPKKGR